MAAKKKATTKKQPKPKTAKAPRKRVGNVAMVLRVPKEAIAYLDRTAGTGARTKVVREALAKADATLAKVLSSE